jgi:hypothetical protein
MLEHRLPRTSEQKAVTHLAQQDLADRWRLSRKRHIRGAAVDLFPQASESAGSSRS